MPALITPGGAYGVFKKRNKQIEKPVKSTLDLRRVCSEENNARDMQLAESLCGICAGEFPDNEHNSWNLVRICHPGNRTYAMVEPDPKDVGYDRFVFVLDYTVSFRQACMTQVGDPDILSDWIHSRRIRHGTKDYPPGRAGAGEAAATF